MASLVTLTDLPAELRPGVDALLAHVEAATGAPALDDQHRLAHGTGHGPGFVAVVGTDAGGEVVAYGQASHTNDAWSLAAVLPPEQRDDAGALRTLLQALVDGVAAAGGGEVHWWSTTASTGDAEVAASVGLAPGRVLYQMRVPLPIEAPATLPTRAFVPGQDEDAWLAVNNRAFASHPEQGGWDRAALALRMAEPWFDPAGFLLFEEEGRLLGFCWTKVHADHDPVLGEIYAIAADPDAQGRGLGKALTVAGLDSLHRRGVEHGMLYVDADNIAAVRLYRNLGFQVDRAQQAFAGDVPAAP